MSSTEFLQAGNFNIIIPRENYPTLRLSVQQVMHPSVELGSTEIPIPKITTFSLPGDSLSYGTLNLDILLDKELKAYKDIYSWMKTSVDSTRSNKEAELSDMSLIILDSSNNSTVATIKYFDAYPISVGDLVMNSTSPETFISFPVTFKISNFEM